MSFLFGRQPQMSSEQKIAQAEAEVDMVSDMYTRLVGSCSKKCIDTSYREPDLNKGESVCLDRCVAKFFEVNVKVSEKMQGEAQSQAGGGAAGAGGGRFGGGM
ncbi:Tim10/DDP family zinc finger-domain-containing protein [Massariosphaeria phaeospora]|uniref:Mitochondrial import inner membrane translocase subunit n=1 Tax=Massariosphaeria phaeospora TaxID=100035 RepID=A0A7C8I221_9PLEO|nr:Tim10/DDP family zinc finger-domain-containing protein [Massariosphaeria phaeospora]